MFRLQAGTQKIASRQSKFIVRFRAVAKHIKVL